MKDRRYFKDYAVIVEGDEIADILPYEEARSKYARYEVLDASDCIVMPGLINLHTHAAMSLLRGYADDLPLHEWLTKWIWPLEAKMRAEDIYYGALLAAVESVLGGTTVLNTMYHYTDPDYNEASAISKVGIRCVIGHVCFSWRKDEDLKALDDLVKRWHGAVNGLVRISIDPHAPYTVDPEYLKTLRQLTDEYNSKYGDKGKITMHIHLAETRDEAERVEREFKVNVEKGLAVYLDQIGVLRDDVVAAHCVWMTDEDIEVMARRRASVAHNPVSNLKLASGIAPVSKMLMKGVNVGLGTDSACSNNTLDMFETMKLASLLQKGMNLEPTLVPAFKAIEMATINGAKALKWEDEIGTIEIGKKADLIAVTFRRPHMTPIYDPFSHIVYAARSLDVKHVVVNGRIVVRDHELLTVDVDEVIRKASKVRDELLSRLKEA